MNRPDPKPVSAREKLDGSREARPDANRSRAKPVSRESDGKNDSGPDPEVHNRQIPPQD